MSRNETRPERQPQGAEHAEIEATHLGIPSRIAVGLFALGPIAASVLVVATALVWPSEGILHFRDSETLGWLTIPTTIPIFVFAAWLVYGLLAYHNERLSPNRKVGWFVAFLLAGPIAMPIYWIAHVWRAPHSASGGTRVG